MLLPRSSSSIPRPNDQSFRIIQSSFCFYGFGSLPELWLWEMRLDDPSGIACRLVDLQFVYLVILVHVRSSPSSSSYSSYQA